MTIDARAVAGGSLSMAMVPPASQTIDRQIVSPRPLPSALVVKKGSRTREQVLGGDAVAGVGDDDVDASVRTGAR